MNASSTLKYADPRGRGAPVSPNQPVIGQILAHGDHVHTIVAFTLASVTWHIVLRSCRHFTSWDLDEGVTATHLSTDTVVLARAVHLRTLNRAIRNAVDAWRGERHTLTIKGSAWPVHHMRHPDDRALDIASCLRNMRNLVEVELSGVRLDTRASDGSTKHGLFHNMSSLRRLRLHNLYGEANVPDFLLIADNLDFSTVMPSLTELDLSCERLPCNLGNVLRSATPALTRLILTNGHYLGLLDSIVASPVARQLVHLSVKRVHDAKAPSTGFGLLKPFESLEYLELVSCGYRRADEEEMWNSDLGAWETELPEPLRQAKVRFRSRLEAEEDEYAALE